MWLLDLLPANRLLQNENIFSRTHLLEYLWPHRDADFSNMRFAEQQCRAPGAQEGLPRPVPPPPSAGLIISWEQGR